jgi:hypothetical protein
VKFEAQISLDLSPEPGEGGGHGAEGEGLPVADIG